MKVMKRASMLVVVFCASFMLLQIYRYTVGAKVIGTICGAEWDQILIESTVYEIDHSNYFSSAAKGRFLGVVVSGDTKFRIYDVKGDNEGQFIYRLWDWEGNFYRRVN